MKQGRADHSGPAGRKIEPRSQSINPGYADSIGQSFGNHASDGCGDMPFKTTPMNDGRGTISAPMAGTKTHKGGSQGSY